MSVTEIDLVVRKVQLDMMRQRLEDCDCKTNLVELEIGSQDLVQCPVNANHYISKQQQQQHVDTCKYKQRGISSDEMRKFGERGNGRGVIIISNKLEEDILEECKKHEDYRTHIKEIAKMSSTEDQVAASLHYSYEALQRHKTARERCQLYDYSIARSKDIAPEITTLLPDPFKRTHRSMKGEKTHTEGERIRDAKRRRKSYRGGKGVKNWNLKEETKELIDLYMNYIW